MKIRLQVFFFAAIILAAAGPALHGAGAFVIDDALERMSLDCSLSFYVDPSGSLGIDQVSDPGFRNNFVANTQRARTFGYDPSVFWIRLEAVNPAPRVVRWVLEYGYQLIDEITLYAPLGKGYAAVETGDRHAFATRAVAHRTFLFPLDEPPGRRVYYVRLHSQGTVPLVFTAWKQEALHASIQNYYIFIWIYYGIFLGLIFYNLFIFLSVRDRSYLYLGVLLISYVLASMSHNGLAAQFLWPGAPDFANFINPFLIFLASCMALVFSRSFLNTRDHLPLLDRIIRGMIALAAAVMLVSPLIDYHYFTQMSVWYTGVVMVYLMFLSVLSLLYGDRSARYYFFSWILMILSLLLLMFASYGVIPYYAWVGWAYHAASAFMVLLLSLGLADKMNIIRDEREKALKSFKEADEKYKTLVENAHEGILMVIDEKIVYANRSMVSMTGFSSEDFLNRGLGDFFPDTPMGRDLVLARYRERMNGNVVVPQYEAEMLTARDEVIDVIISASPITVQDRRGIVAIITDISELKRAHEVITSQFHEIQSQCEEVESVNSELKKAHREMAVANESLSRETEKLSITLKSIGEGVITMDTNGVIDIMNSAAERITGYSHDEARGRRIGEVLVIETSRGRSLEGLAEDFAAARKLLSSEKDIVVTDKQGARKFILPILSEIRDSADEVIGAILVLNDITQRKKLEDEILKTSKIESLGVFAGGIAHDFNNLLTAIVGNISLVMLDMDRRDRHYKYLSDAEKMTGRAADLTRQLLTFSRGGAPVKKTASGRDLLSDTVEFVLSGSSVKADMDLAPDLWNAEIDEGQISQVIQNLILNAIQAMPGGGAIHVTAENVSGARGADFIRIVISDEGPGIPPDNIAKIFDPFFTTKPGGNGLGLSICYSIIRKHEGHINVLPDRHGGAAFEVLLPASNKTPQPVKKEAVTMQFSARALFMDDEVIIQDVGKRMLARLGLDVEIARDGAEAIEKFGKAREKGRPFDLIIMDLTIPGGMGGRDATARIRESDSDVLIVASSGYFNDPVMAHYADYGFNAVISKPYSLEQMAELIQGLLRGRQ
jgi:PAS domain S-box-containing protein